jgi:hypothetical protein
MVALDIEEGFITINHNGRRWVLLQNKSNMPYPKQGNNFYHLSNTVRLLLLTRCLVCCVCAIMLSLHPTIIVHSVTKYLFFFAFCTRAVTCCRTPSRATASTTCHVSFFIQ